MSRPLRIEFAGALHHVSTRADRCEPVFEDVAERERSLRQPAEVAGAFDRQVRACCPMGNHFHLLVKPTDAERRARARCGVCLRIGSCSGRPFTTAGRVVRGARRRGADG